ncbi:hypothetical protein V3C99_014697 [Haemonchus contortus]|uniref:Protein quiver n=1 Tax=Haemonchus contortus TaxID=6289 RepID=A0A7I5EC96_HAECO
MFSAPQSLQITVLYTLLLTVFADVSKLECFSCTSNANWNYYMERIPGLKSLNATEALPVAPLACTFDPMRIYAAHTAVSCDGYCMKWASVKILDDGGLEVNFLRACVESVMEKNSSLPADDRCYQTPPDFVHKPGVEYRSICFCQGFMCNSTMISHSLGVFLTMLISLLLFL